MGRERFLNVITAAAIGIGSVLAKAEPKANQIPYPSTPGQTVCVPPGYYLCQDHDGSPTLCAIGAPQGKGNIEKQSKKDN